MEENHLKTLGGRLLWRLRQIICCFLAFIGIIASAWAIVFLVHLFDQYDLCRGLLWQLQIFVDYFTSCASTILHHAGEIFFSICLGPSWLIGSTEHVLKQHVFPDTLFGMVWLHAWLVGHPIPAACLGGLLIRTLMVHVFVTCELGCETVEPGKHVQ